MAGDINGRLDRIEKRLNNQRLQSCNCVEISKLVQGKEEKFEAELNLPCPYHGLRNLGLVVITRFEKSDKIDELLQRHRERHEEIKRRRAEEQKKIREELLRDVIQEERLAM